MPEVNAMSALHRISKDYKIPIMYFSFDSQTSETGIKTRIEAFHDMLIMKKNGKFNI
jgi:benzoyl-CoA reductase/2-hydroxyglutaryl-CoA dehydratase subunit BcrC/BadD/HgdB